MANDRTDVCLVLMPYAAVERPSIALSILKASLAGSPIQSGILYPNIRFAEMIGLRLFKYVETSPNEDLIGEWTFAGALFPDFHPDHDAFLKRVKFSTFQSGRGVLFGERPFEEVMFAIREKAEEFLEETAHRVLDLRPSIVACSSVFQQHVSSLALLKRIHELAPSVITMIGGSNCEGPMGLTTRRLFPWLDYVVSGEADLLFPELCSKAMECGRSLSPRELPYGVLGRDTNATAFRTEDSVLPRTVLQDMDQCPIPDYDDYFDQWQQTGLKDNISPGLLVETSRGCWWGAKHHCTFCGLNGYGMEYRSKSPQRVVEEFRYLATRHGINNFEVVDNILDTRYIKTVVPLLRESGPFEIFYETKANLKYEEMKELAGAGIRSIQPGIESMHNSILKLLDKGNRTWINIQVLKWAQELGIRINWLFLLHVPGEKDEWYQEMADLIPMISHLAPPMGVTRIQYHRFSPYQQRPADFGLNLRAGLAYSYVYPFSDEDLLELAYFFDDINDTAKLEMKSNVGPGLAAFLRKEIGWNMSWNAPGSYWRDEPVLTMKDSGDKILILDTRHCATEMEHTLEGFSAQIYRICDRATPLKAIVDSLRQGSDSDISEDSVSQILSDLIRRNLLVELEGRFLSLAVREPRRAAPRKWPGGEIRLDEQEPVKVAAD